ncbi:MAG: DEAD/DEAH box helicase [Peptidiphaga sp.]
MTVSDALGAFTPAVRDWFESAFAGPTPVQVEAWAAIDSGDNALVIAPTGSGKTLAAFMHAIDGLYRERDAAQAGGAGRAPDGDDGRARGKRAGKALSAAGPDAAGARLRDASAPPTRVLYVSPLKALGADVQRNLRAPLQGIAARRSRRGDPEVRIDVGMRTGDTPGGERARLLRRPPQILITTPESLFLMLTSRARETLQGVRTVIVDEVHAVAGTKRGAHLAVSLERLDALLPRPAQRVGLSATVRPVEEVAAFLGGASPVTVVNPPSSRRLDLRVAVPVEDMTLIPVPQAAAADGRDGDPPSAGRRPPGGPGSDGGRGAPEGPDRSPAAGQTTAASSIWPHVEASILDRILAHRSTIVFVNSRGLAERLTARLNGLYSARFGDPDDPAGDGPAAGPGTPAAQAYDSWSGGTQGRASDPARRIARAHHGSVSKERRASTERDLKSGALRCVVATSSLELGIDMGLVDEVIQVGVPPSAASGLQRVGRAGHAVGGIPSGVVYPRTRRDLLDAAVVVDRMRAGLIEALQMPDNPLDVLAQQTVAAVAMEPLETEAWYRLVRRSRPFRRLPRSAFDATLDMLAGRYPSTDFAELRPRIVWDRQKGTLIARPGAQRLAVTSGGTIPDRGAYSVILPEGEEAAGARRVGELDEEMVYESRVGDVVALGATTWRILEITDDRVVVAPAPGRSARLPFWRGDGAGRPAELGAAIGGFLADLDAAVADGDPDGRFAERLAASGLDGNAVSNLLALALQQCQATGALPTDRRLVVERVRDEAGDWRIILHSPHGRRVHEPWALIVAERIRRRWKVDPSVVAGDDGIVARVPDADGRVPGADAFEFDPADVRRLVGDAVSGSALFASRFRECAARALLLPKRNPGRRSPLWQQRLRAGQLLQVAGEHPGFPVLVETARECLHDVYDVEALTALMERIRDGRVRFAEATTAVPSPFAADLLFGYVAEFLYESDAPLAERRTSLLSLDSGLLADLLGGDGYADVLDPAVADLLGRELQCLTAGRRVRGREGLADLLRRLGPLTGEGVLARVDAEPRDAAAWLSRLEEERRIVQVTVAGERRWAAVEDSPALRDALAVDLPDGVPEAFLEPTRHPLRDLAARYARTHTAFTSAELAAHLGLGVAVVDAALADLCQSGRLLAGTFDPRRLAPERRAEQWIDPGVLSRLRSRSLKAARDATEPAPQRAYARLLLEHHGLLHAPAGDPLHAGPAEAQPAGTGQSAGTGAAGAAAWTAGGALWGVDGLLRAVEQLAGVPLPASLWETQILPARVRDYAPAMLDELISTGAVVWSGHGRLGDRDGLIALHLAEYAAETLPEPSDRETETGSKEGERPGGGSHGAPASPLAGPSSPASGASPDLRAVRRAIVEVLADGGAYFPDQLATLAGRRICADPAASAPRPGAGIPPADVSSALWDLAWSGRVTTDTWAAPRSLIAAPPPRRRIPASPRRRRHARIAPGRTPARTGGAGGLGRWSLLRRDRLDDREPDEMARGLSLAEGLLDRYAILTRDAVASDGVPGGFASLRRLLRGMEEAGRVLRGRFVDGLGAAQFAERATVDRLRDLADAPAGPPAPIALSAADPANPYGAVLPWPPHPTAIRPARRPGAFVVIDRGELVLYLPQGGRALLTYGRGSAETGIPSEDAGGFDGPSGAGDIDESRNPADGDLTAGDPAHGNPAEGDPTAGAGGDPTAGDPDRDASVGAALQALAAALRRGAVTFTVETVDARPATASPIAARLREAGFAAVPRGFRWRG